MIKFVVIEKKENGEWQGHGTNEFESAPRIGEYIEFNDADGIGQVYSILAVIHPLEPTMTAGDILIRHISNTTDFRKSL